MNKSATISSLMKALIEVQGKMPSIKMNSKNPMFNSKYADLGAVIETSKPLLQENGLAISQFVTSKEVQIEEEEEGQQSSTKLRVKKTEVLIGVTTILAHSSGEYMEDTVYMPLTKSKGVNPTQQAGINVTYLRRYAWASILGMYADEDVDGNQSSSQANGFSVSKIKNDVSTIYSSHKELRDEFNEALKRVGYSKDTKDVEVIVLAKRNLLDIVEKNKSEKNKEEKE